MTAPELTGATLRQAAALVQKALEAAGCPDGDVDARELVELATGKDPRLNEGVVTARQSEALAGLVCRRCSRYPLQYLAGKWYFLDFELEVGEGVLIPRSDTEVVCEAAAAVVKGMERPQVLDLCAGSGCLGLGIRRLVPAAQVTELEKSPEALYWLEKNVHRALLPRGIPAPACRIAEGDVFTFQRTLQPESLDLIVSNPPYLTSQEMTELQPEVAFEPAMALDGGEDGGEFYRHIIKEYAFALKNGGWLVFEIGEQQRELLFEAFRRSGWQGPVTCQKDYGGNDRVILAQKVL